MTEQIVYKTYLKKLVESLGKNGRAKLAVGAEVSASSVRDALAGRLPGQETRTRIAAFFKVPEDKLFPHVLIEVEAA